MSNQELFFGIINELIAYIIIGLFSIGAMIVLLAFAGFLWSLLRP